MSKKYAVLGAGMQGTAAAYDLAMFAEPDAIHLGDASLEQAQRSADRVNKLVSKSICVPFQVDALDRASLSAFLNPVDMLISAVPYWMHPRIAPVAIDTHTCMVDMGGDTRVARKTLTLDADAKAAGVSIVPDTGLAPGLVNNLGAYLMENFDETDSITLYCGGLPMHPKPPFNYKLVFNIEGLITEYMDEADVIRDGKLALVPTLEELEPIEIDGLGSMEAFVTSGGVSTATDTYLGKVKNYQYKTIRFPGHCEKMRLFKQFGFWSNDPIDTRSGSAIPRELFCAVMNPQLKDPTDTDRVLVRAIGTGTKDGKAVRGQLDIHHVHNAKTGFSAMEQLTGSSSAIVAAHVANGGCPHGCRRYETAMTGHDFVTALRKRGVEVKES